MGASTIYFSSTNGAAGAERSLKQWAFLRIDRIAVGFVVLCAPR